MHAHSKNNNAVLLMALILGTGGPAHGEENLQAAPPNAGPPSQASAFIEKRMFRNAYLLIKAMPELLCSGPVVYSPGYQKASGTVDCLSGEAGTVTADLETPLGDGHGKAVFTNGREIAFRVTQDRIKAEELESLWEEWNKKDAANSLPSQPLPPLQVETNAENAPTIPQSIVPEQPQATPQPAAPAQRMYAGNGKVEGLIIDAEGVTEEKFNGDVAACRRLRKQAENDVVADAVLGALLGSAVAKSSGGKYSRRDGAKAGATAMVIEGEAESRQEKAMVFRNCMVGRGYRVLN